MAPADDDISIEEKRVYAGTAGRTDAYVATADGLVRVAASGDKIGSFELVADVAASDVAVYGGDPEDGAAGHSAPVLAVATETDLLVAALDDDADTDGTADPDLHPVGFGPAAAVGVYDDAFLVAGADGTVARVDPDVEADAGGEPAADGAAAATPLGTVSDPRAVDGPLVAAADGVHRVVERGTDGEATLESVGLDDVADVAGSGVPLAATPEGVYWLGNGWMDALAGETTRVAADGDGHAMAVVDDELYVRTGTDGAGGSWDADAWTPATLPVAEPPVALGYGPGVSAVVTAAGTLCLDAGDGWRHQVIGIRDAKAVALTPPTDD
ncbi:hypothetical protein JCM17823_22570 [Halorubrum gandharaense]